jgi:uncharacterized protein (DUF1684 family)
MRYTKPLLIVLLMLTASAPGARAQRTAQPPSPASPADSALQAWQGALLNARLEKDEAFRRKKQPPFKTEKDRKAFGGLDYFAPDPAWRISCRVERLDEAGTDTLELPTSAGTTKRFMRYAVLHCPLPDGKERLTAYRSVQHMSHPVYGRQLFVPFTDANSGELCYGGGRYLDPALPNGDSLILDFNEAYNPYCAYSDGWFCPIPPAENALRSAVQAGEKAYVPGQARKDKTGH